MIKYVKDTEVRKIGQKGLTRTYAIAYCTTCNREFETQKYRIKNMTNCRKCSSLKHGMGRSGKNRHRLYRVWDKIKQRCHNPNSDSYKDYGARGISMYKPWFDNFVEFRDWCINNGWSEDLEVDRKNNDKGYNPKNVRFITSAQNSRNTRKLRKNNTVGFKCVYPSGNKWVARITVDYNYITIGSYKTKEDAAIAYDKYVFDNNLEHTFNFDKYKKLRESREREILNKLKQD